MLLKQISVFVENRVGAMLDITSVLAEKDINLRAITIADTADFGIVRLIVDKRKAALEAFKEARMTVIETDVLALAIDDTPGSFHKALKTLVDNNITVEYSYGFVSPVGGGATIILKCDNMTLAHDCLEKCRFRLLTADDLQF